MLRKLLTAILLLGGGLFGVPLLLAGGWVAYRVGGDYLLRRDFDPERWRGAALADPTLPRGSKRSRMVDDLLLRYQLEGMPRAEAVTLLGKPDNPRIGESRESFPGWDLVYHLGPERGLIVMDDEWLALRLGADGRVEEVRIIES